MSTTMGRLQEGVYAIGWGWCEETAIPVDGPKYQTRYFDSWIEPGRSGLPLSAIKIPMWEGELARPVIYGRVFYETVFGDRFSSGFLYRLPKDEPGDSESILPPHPSYTEYRKEKAGSVATLRGRLWRSWRRGSVAGPYFDGTVWYIKPMLRTCSRIIVLAAMVAGPSMTAQAADTTLTLACEGTATETVHWTTGPAAMGIVVNFTNRTVQGFPTGFPVKISRWDDGIVEFSGSGDSGSFRSRILGHIDRVTGDFLRSGLLET
jgi:hypothetical protein